ncbi:MAG: hypothetical protein L0H70_00925, partial [Xanthomonadales bacterium]|nr:hypothetical protein [Xanthomonadales bacterium]
VDLLTVHGIESHVTDMPGHRGRGYARFSYRDNDSANWPKVWIVHSADLVRARALLRDVGIDPTIRFADDLANARKAAANPAAKRQRITRHVRVVLLAIIAILAALMVWHRFMG